MIHTNLVGNRQLQRLGFHSFATLLITLLVSAPGVAEQTEVNKWHYTLEKPADGWQQPDFDASSWKQGPGGFGTRGTPGARVGTHWKTNDIWLRTTFDIDSMPTNPGLQIHHDEDAQVYINGVKVVTMKGFTSDYQVVSIDPQYRETLKPGRNVMAVHCSQTTGGQYIDVIFVDADNPPPLPTAPPFLSELITKWGSELTAENAWTEYPRPQMARSNWTNLNGNWDYAVTADKQVDVPASWDGQILVPFCLESKLGGVQQMLGADQALWYHRRFKTALNPGQRTLLNFEAVDYQCEVFVNGTSVGQHQGGNTPFSFDVTDALTSGDNELVVRVEDDTEAWQLRGKQVVNAGGIFYTQVSGIWQTVWLETVQSNHLTDLEIRTDADAGTITVQSQIANPVDGGSIQLVVKDGDTQIASVSGTTEQVSVTLDSPKLWSPDSPHLYELEISLLGPSGQTVDQVHSYAGIRSVGKTRDADGHWRMTLNGEIIFHWGPLDQGWWPDGLLTPPSDEAMLFDIEWLKSAGFNMIRKHIKVEPRRYYYHCDRLGMMVWQDQVSGGRNPKWTHLAADPNDAEWPDDQHQQFMTEFEWMVDELENHPSIVVWVPFNEAWGQHRTMEVGKWSVQRDPSRLINIASGGNFWPVGDIVDQHSYPDPSFPFDANRYQDFIKVVGEFGGHGYPVQGHLWDADRDNWGYGGLPKTKQEYRDRYIKSLEVLNGLRKQGIAGGVYTQTTDVEGEINGLMTYDRKVIKIPAEELKQLHQQLFTKP
ncbi:glycoside hydrolase family 2 [Stieleria sp. TO1_6]|uniref:glycoside hydrolase family 2 protein n=1 Tax=Stieleria tagensis TaxID=2956795 RepID=UPI00209B6F57|nr:sugar-binding domain-containing protein [Stieleria tagensis]MCO8124618.1 glycoside hydrolase family 2 [Stieleria tagensis]